MNWIVTHQADRRACILADRHYSRQKPGSKQFTPPGRKLVLINAEGSACWVTSWPFMQYVKRAYPDAWLCSFFRNESTIRSSELIAEALSITRWKYGEPPQSGIITLVDATKIQSNNPGYCYKCAGFKHVGNSKGGLHILQLPANDIPAPIAPLGAL